MNTSRIEIPLTPPPPPHFDDESTVAAARQVKPIGRAKVTFRVRKVRAMLPLLFAATLCGALGAAAVNYYERRHPVQSVAAPETPVSTRTQPPPVAVSASSELGGGKIAGNQAGAAPAKVSGAEIDATKQELPKTETETEALIARRNDEPRESTTSKAPKNPSGDPAKLTRQRRVRSVDGPVPANKNGAGRITDLFSGPNP